MYLRPFYAFLYLLIWNSQAEEVDIGYFWHISDIHVDQNYSRTGNPFNLCHRGAIPYPDNGLYGNFLCDSPQYLVNVTVNSMKSINPVPNFILWTGDNLPHTRHFDPNYDVVFETLNNISMMMSTTFPGTPVYPCIGNHDTFPPNVLLPNSSSYSIYEGYLTKGGWNKFLDEETWTTFHQGGYYTKLFKPGLRIISLNTILWYSSNYYTSHMIDPAGQFQWLENVLLNSSELSEKVYIIGHVPPGFYNRVIPGDKSIPLYHPQYLNTYLKILKNNSEVIHGQMFGHLHIDMFQLFPDDNGDYISSSLLASSVTPWHSIDKYNVSIPVNPSLRLMKYSIKNVTLLDFDQFFLNLSRVNFNSTQESNNLYELLYTFTKSYSVPDLSTQSLVKVFDMMKSDSDVFNTFFNFATAGKKSVICDRNCKVAQLCSIGHTSIYSYDSCMEKGVCGIFPEFRECKSRLALTVMLVIFALLLTALGCFVVYRYRNYLVCANDYKAFQSA